MRIKMLKRVIGFLKYNGEKWMTITVYIYAAYYRMCMLFIPKPRLEKKMGIRGVESEAEVPLNDIKMAKLVGFHVNRVTGHTPWESKCLVRAMTARKILMKKGINTTLYLGVGTEDDKMVAHAWLRCGALYVTGGNGSQYATVAKFKAF